MNLTVTDEMVNRFLTWPLPASVCADLVATRQNEPHRTGTTLLTAVEARAMLEHVLQTQPAPVAAEVKESPDDVCVCGEKRSRHTEVGCLDVRCSCREFRSQSDHSPDAGKDEPAIERMRFEAALKERQSVQDWWEKGENVTEYGLCWSILNVIDAMIGYKKPELRKEK